MTTNQYESRRLEARGDAGDGDGGDDEGCVPGTVLTARASATATNITKEGLVHLTGAATAVTWLRDCTSRVHKVNTGYWRLYRHWPGGNETDVTDWLDDNNNLTVPFVPRQEGRYRALFEATYGLDHAFADVTLDVGVLTDAGPSGTSADNNFIFVATNREGEVLYNWGQLGGELHGWIDLGGRIEGTPAAALVGTYMFVTGKGPDGYLWLSQGDLGRTPVDWMSGFDFQTDVAPAAGSSGDLGVTVAKHLDGRTFYTWSRLGGQPAGWADLGGRTAVSPAAALIGNYVYVFVRGLDGDIWVNHGTLGGAFTGFRSGHDFQTDVAPGAAASGEHFVVVAKHPDGRVFYAWSALGGAPSGWIDLGGNTDASPGAALVGTYLYVTAKGPDGRIYLNQGPLGGNFVGWR